MLCISKVLVPLHTIHIYIYIKDILEAHCYVVITSESILMSKYIAESINQLQTTDCRTFQPRRPSSAAYKTEVTAV